MDVLVVNHRQVRQHLTMPECVELMERTLGQMSDGTVINPLRGSTWLPDKSGLMATMPACLLNSEVMGIKALSVFPGNFKTDYESHQGVVLLFKTSNGRLLAIVDASAITAVRTAAVSGAATNKLARKDARILSILGTGTQATAHLTAIKSVRDIQLVKAWNPFPNLAEEFAERESKNHDLKVEAVDSAEQAVTDADIICTVTPASDPILKGEWISEGTHINAVGSCTPVARELDSDAVKRSRLFVDLKESALNEAGDILIPLNEGVIDSQHIIGEIGDVFANKIEGRTANSDITLFKALGIAAEDVASAHFLYQKLKESDEGIWNDIGPMREDLHGG